MPPIPSEQQSPYGPRSGGKAARPVSEKLPHAAAVDPAHRPRGPPDSDVNPAFLTTKELAERWKRTRKTIERNYAAWGLTPARFGGGPLLFAFPQILEAEARAMAGEFVNR